MNLARVLSLELTYLRVLFSFWTSAHSLCISAVATMLIPSYLAISSGQWLQLATIVVSLIIFKVRALEVIGSSLYNNEFLSTYCALITLP